MLDGVDARPHEAHHLLLLQVCPWHTSLAAASLAVGACCAALWLDDELKDSFHPVGMILVAW